MSHFSNSIGPNGPILNVLVAPSAPRRIALEEAGKVIPPPVAARLLIDTGASLTSIDESILATLNLKPTGAISMLTPSTGSNAVQMPTYDVELLFTGHAGAAHMFQSMPVIGCDFSAQGIDGLFGRDALAQSRLTYGGPDDFYMLSF